MASIQRSRARRPREAGPARPPRAPPSGSTRSRGRTAPGLAGIALVLGLMATSEASARPPRRSSFHVHGGVAHADLDSVDEALRAAGYRALNPEWAEVGGALELSVGGVRVGAGMGALIVGRTRNGATSAWASATAFDLLTGVDVYSEPRFALYLLLGAWLGSFRVRSEVGAPALFAERVGPLAPLLDEDAELRVKTPLFAPRLALGMDYILVERPRELAERTAMGHLVRIEAGYRAYFGGRWHAAGPFRDYVGELGRSPRLRSSGPYVTLGIGMGTGTEKGHPPVCPDPPNARGVWDGTECGFECLPHAGDCNGAPADGCETRLDTVSDCGACGAACAVSRGLGVCAATPAGVGCVLAHCDPGRGNCNGLLSDGCEADLMADADHCGACGRSCAERERCSLGECRFF